jgi:hypothetical protein
MELPPRNQMELPSTFLPRNLKLIQNQMELPQFLLGIVVRRPGYRLFRVRGPILSFFYNPYSTKAFCFALLSNSLILF